MPNIDIIDLSHHNWTTKPDFAQVKKSIPNLKGIIIKATEGIHYIDPKLNDNYKGALSLEKPIGFYHFLSSTLSGAEQATHFLETIKKLPNFNSIKKIIPALDVEEDKIHNTNGLQMIINNFFQILFNNGISKSLFYSSPAFIKYNLSNTSKYISKSLWLAHYNVNKPSIPLQWQNNFFLWQFGAQNIKGFTGLVDVNQINLNFDFNSVLYT
jgi:GH25 family lysozyme M1 (1,4-beta-N-acetylmuramidase)